MTVGRSTVGSRNLQRIRFRKQESPDDLRTLSPFVRGRILGNRGEFQQRWGSAEV
jgi:hypothetical protein